MHLNRIRKRGNEEEKVNLSFQIYGYFFIFIQSILEFFSVFFLHKIKRFRFILLLLLSFSISLFSLHEWDKCSMHFPLVFFYHGFLNGKYIKIFKTKLWNRWKVSLFLICFILFLFFFWKYLLLRIQNI